MINSINDFTSIWKDESSFTLKLLRELTDESLAREVYPGGRTLGRLANHILESVTELPSKLQLGIEEEHPKFTNAKDIAVNYERCSLQLAQAVQSRWTDADLLKTNPMYGEEWANAFSLQVLILHQCHHRGQMTILMRQAGLKVPGIYGPAKEEWAAFGLPSMD